MRALAWLLWAGLALGCQGPAATWVEAPLGGPGRIAPTLPDALDAAAARLAVATLSGKTPAAASALQALEDAEQRERGGSAPSGLLGHGREAAASVLSPGRGWREAIDELLDAGGPTPVQRERLERALADDPLVLARKRLFEARFTGVARVFNAVSAPVGRSILNPIQLPYTLGYSLARVAIDSADGDALSLRRRQALKHWRDFARRHPDAPEVAELTPRIARYQDKWNRTRAQAALTRARDARKGGRLPAARLYAGRSLREAESEAARELAAELDEALAAERRARDRSLGFAAESEAPIAAAERRSILIALAGSAPDVAASPAKPPPASAELRFLGAGSDAEGWAELEELANERRSPMARHAAASLADPLRHPERAYRRARSAERRRTALWVTVGPLSVPPQRGWLGAARYLLELPLRVQALALSPIRALELAWRKPTPGHARAAAHARRYLALHPEGSHVDDLRGWLLRYEKRRKNWLGVLRLREAAGSDAEEVAKLRERAAEQALGVSRDEERADLRAAMLSEVARRFADTDAGRKARTAVREQAFEATPHEIRFSRGFLLENPEVRGPQGLDLSPALLDEDPRNGELHPDGVALVGGREVTVALLAASGDDEDPPEKLWVTLPADRLARLVARVEESRFERSLLDADDALEPDPQRDAVFERARLGLADEIDTRPGASARHTYRGMRERYGMVRSRESILPVALVVQGSLSDLSLGAFPRLIPPRETPDAVLYRD